MSVENALKVMVVAEGASSDEILGAKNSIMATCKDDQYAVSQMLTKCSMKYLHLTEGCFH